MENSRRKATLLDLAFNIGATFSEINQLSPDVKQLTKDQLLALWGTTSTPDAYKNYLRMDALPDPLMMPLHLTLQDVRSIQQVFTLERVQAALSAGRYVKDTIDITPDAGVGCCSTSASILENRTSCPDRILQKSAAGQLRMGLGVPAAERIEDVTNDEVAKLRLRALPVQLIPMRSAVILRRGGTEVRINGERAREAVEMVLTAVSGEGATMAEVCERFADPDRPAVTRLLGELCTRRLLVPAGSLTETPAGDDTIAPVGDSRLDVFYWHFGQRAADVARSLSARRVAVVGVNAVSQRLVCTLTAIGATNIEIVDYPPLRNVDLAAADHGPDSSDAAVVCAEWLDRADVDEVHCVIATSDFGASDSLRLWNRFCVERGIPFLPVVQRDLVGTVGPLVMPGETPCYECLHARESSHVDDLAAHHADEETAFEGQRLAALHPSAVTVLAELAGVELSKWFGGGRPPTRQVGTLIEVNVAEPYLAVRKVLRLPRCPVCSPNNARSAGAVRNSDFDPR